MVNKLIIGTVQLGLNYGVNNLSGKPSIEECYKILNTAHSAGIFLLDTAEGYGDAIDVIGGYHKQSSNLFHVINKFGSIKEIINLKKNVKDSLHKLNINSFYSYLFHSPADLNNLNSYSQFLTELNELKAEGLVKKIGVSVYTNEDFKLAINNLFIDTIQLPFNLLDNNNKRLELMKLAKSKGKEIHCRSVFLQGLFYKDPTKLSKNLKPLSKYLIKLNEISVNLNHPLSQLAISYALNNPYIDKVLIGVDSEKQLLENIKMANEKADQTYFDLIDNIINVSEEELLYPYNW